jgi:hypothetical protein
MMMSKRATTEDKQANGERKPQTKEAKLDCCTIVE